MKRRSTIVSLAIAAVILSISGCNKDNLLVGTSWICKQDHSKLFFKSNSTGTYSWSENGGIELYDFSYNYEKGNVVVQVSFPERVFMMSGKLDGNSMHLGGKEIPLDYYKSE